MSGDGLPPGIAAIMAALRQEVAAPPEPLPDEEPAEAAAVPPDAPPAAAIPAPPPALAIDAEARALIAPMLKDWLDRNLPEIVERTVLAELRRLTGDA